MDINKAQDGDKLVITLTGSLDTNTSPELSEVLDSSLTGITDLTFDFSNLEYLSSAGLRVLLAAQNTMDEQGEMRVTHPNEVIMDVFTVTGFTEIMDIVS